MACMFCTKCGKCAGGVDISVKQVCPACGKPLFAPLPKCPSCGASLTGGCLMGSGKTK